MRKYHAVIVGISVMVFLLVSVRTVINAQTTSTTIDATVKLSVCGDGIVEGAEECEGNNLAGKACTSFGYTSGALTCDIACSFDKASCSFVSIDSHPVQSSSQPEITKNFSTVPMPSVIPQIKISQSRSLSQALPLSLQAFDIDGDGTLTRSNLHQIVKLWVEDWRKSFEKGVHSDKKCDVNHDTRCDLKDFSRLMYYIER